jgi:hypothetical protein
MFRGLLAAVVALGMIGGCPVDESALDLSGASSVLTDYDGSWRITSETGLVNRYVTIFGDRVTRLSDYDGNTTLVVDAELSARSGNQIIWTFGTADQGAQTQHTISVFVQLDGTLRGTYSVRSPESAFALTDDIIMERRQIRV